MNDSEATLLARARRGLTPAPGDAARVRIALEATLSAPAIARRGRRSPTARASGTPWRLARVGVALALAAATGAGGYVLGYRAGRARPVAPAVIAASAPVPAPSAPPQLDAPAPLHPLPELPAAPPRARPRSDAAHVPAEPAPSAIPIPSASSESPLELETRLLARAERALRDDNPRLALGLVGELEREVPGGQLEEERRAARVIAHCKLGSEFAPKLAAEFSASYPASAYRERIRSACSGATSDE